MKRKEIRTASKEELKKKLKELKKELMKEKAQIRIGSNPSNPGKIKQMKKMIAKITTRLNMTKAEKASSNKQEV